MPDAPRKRLEDVRHALLVLHKALVDSERITYEQTVGAIPSPNHFLQLLMTDPWFAWLQPLSQLIVSLDESLEAKEPLTDAEIAAAIKQTRVLLAPSEAGDGFSRHYFEALQREPDVVMAHGEVIKLLGPRKVK
jgi:hypothetical protein